MSSESQLDMFDLAASSSASASLVAVSAKERDRIVRQHRADGLNALDFFPVFTGTLDAMMDALPAWMHIPVGERPVLLRDATYCYSLSSPIDGRPGTFPQALTTKGWQLCTAWRCADGKGKADENKDDTSKDSNRDRNHGRAGHVSDHE